MESNCQLISPFSVKQSDKASSSFSLLHSPGHAADLASTHTDAIHSDPRRIRSIQYKQVPSSTKAGAKLTTSSQDVATVVGEGDFTATQKVGEYNFR